MCVNQLSVPLFCPNLDEGPQCQKSSYLFEDFFQKSGCRSESMYDMYKTLSPQFFQHIMAGVGTGPSLVSPDKSLFVALKPPAYDDVTGECCSDTTAPSNQGRLCVLPTLSNDATQKAPATGGTVGISAKVLRKLRTNSQEDGSASSSSSSDFLIQVKEQVARLKQETEPSERRYNTAAMLSCVDLSSESCTSCCSSAKSNAATVIGKISPEKAHEYLKLQLEKEGHSARTIAYELSSRMSPDQMRRQHRRRRMRHNQMRIKRFPERFRNRANDRGSEERQGATGTEDEQWTPHETSSKTKLIGSPVSCTTTTEFGEALEPASWNVNELMTRDEKVIAYLRQRLITRKFTHLQKLRDRGELSLLGFEKAKREILFLEVFKYDDVEGSIKIRKTNLQSLEEACTKKRSYLGGASRKNKNSQCNRNGGSNYNKLFSAAAAAEFTTAETDQANRKRQRRNGGVSCLDDEEVPKSFMSSDSLNNEAGQNECNSSSSDDDTTTHVEIYKDDDISAHSKEQDRIACRLLLAQRVQKQMLRIWSKSTRESHRRSEMRLRNFQRREMLMRRFDQRAPPEARMFQQDTTLEKVTKKQENDWNVWRSSWSNASLPEWMHGNQSCRQIIFPQDKKKL